MNLDSLNKWLTLAANFGVIAGIVFLAFELKQNNELLEAQTRFNHKETRVASSMYIGNNKELINALIKSRNSEQLSQQDIIQLDRYRDIVFTSWEWDFKENVNTNLDLPTEAIKGSLRNDPYLVEQWRLLERYYSDDFTQWMNQLISEI